MTKIAEMVPGSTGDLEEQQEMLRKRRFDRHAARLGQISAAASALAVATVHSNAARLQAEKEKNSKAAQTEDQLDKFLYAKVMTDYFLPAVLLSPEDKARLEEKRKREALAAAEAARRWTLACEKEGLERAVLGVLASAPRVARHRSRLLKNRRRVLQRVREGDAQGGAQELQERAAG